MKSFLTQLLLGLLLVSPVAGQIPAGYYDPASGLTGTGLQAALHDIIDDHVSVSYSSLYTCFQSTDIKPDNTVWDMYSDIPGGTPPYVFYYNAGDECGNYSGEGDCYNREHSWPKSWFGGEVYPMYSDLFILYPTDGYVNNRRDNDPYGEVGSASWTSLNGSKSGSSSAAGYSGTVFEPIDDYKGDFARSFFYVSVRYYQEDSAWPGSPMTTGSQLQPWALAMMLSWNSEDPVSQKEINRNNAVYLIQNNRNPFIDHPEYAGLIWGFPSAVPDASGKAGRLAITPNPVRSSCTITLPGNSNGQPGEVRILGMDGKEFRPARVLKENSVVLDAASLAPGMYLVSVTDSRSGQEFHGLMIKQYPD